MILLRWHTSLQPKTFHIGHHADNRPINSTRTIEPVCDAFADWVFSVELATGVGFVDNDYGRRILVVPFRKAATCAQLHAHCIKVVNADYIAYHPHLRRTAHAHPPWKGSDRRSLHTGQGIDACE